MAIARAGKKEVNYISGPYQPSGDAGSILDGNSSNSGKEINNYDGNQLGSTKNSYNKSPSEAIAEEITEEIFNRATNGGDDDDWHPLYKADLQLFFREKNNEAPPTENELGDEFERLFERYVDEKPFLKIEKNVRRYGGPKFTGGDRNTVPDFIGDVLVIGKNITRIKGSDWFELKQKGGDYICLRMKGR